jgi:hypothetical protein
MRSLSWNTTARVACLCGAIAAAELALKPGRASAVASFAIQTGEVCTPLPSCWAGQPEWFLRPLCRNWSKKPSPRAELRRMSVERKDPPGGAETFISACANLGISLRR